MRILVDGVEYPLDARLAASIAQWIFTLDEDSGGSREVGRLLEQALVDETFNPIVLGDEAWVLANAINKAFFRHEQAVALVCAIWPKD